MSSLRILADRNIPCVRQAFSHVGSVQTRAGRAIGPADVAEVDVLLVRSVTDVGPELLEGSAVQFVGSATIGVDHVDRSYLEAEGIAFAHAPASNADSVADYVVAALLDLARQKRIPLGDRTVGIVGCGNIGTRLARRLPALGVSVLCNDPLRKAAGEEGVAGHEFVSLDRVLSDSDTLTLHVPLTDTGSFPTRHLVDRSVLRQLVPDAWIINTSRGSVVDGEALLEAIEGRQVGGVVLDVWENEPAPNVDLIRAVDVATPHIAGYAYDGKVRGTTMLYDALCEYLDVEPKWSPREVLQPEDPDALRCYPPDPRLPSTDWLHILACQAYDLGEDDEKLRQLIERPSEEQGDYFRSLRAAYPRRREFQKHTVPAHGVSPSRGDAVTTGLGMQLGIADER